MEISKHPALRGSMKTAAFGSFKAMPEATQTALIGSAAITGLGLAVSGAQAGVEKLYELYEKNKAFKEMLTLTPALQKEDQTIVKRYFNSLYRANPHFMTDPSVAGAHVHAVVVAQKDLGGIDRPPLALATAVSNMATGRAQLTQALEREHKMRPDLEGRVHTVGREVTDALTSAAEHRDRQGMIGKQETELKDLEGRVGRAKNVLAEQEGRLHGYVHRERDMQEHGQARLQDLARQVGNRVERIQELEGRLGGMQPAGATPSRKVVAEPGLGAAGHVGPSGGFMDAIMEGLKSPPYPGHGRRG